MSSIEELQQRVVQAEEHFGLLNAERAKYSERLMGLIDAIETRLGDQQSEIERQAGETASQAEELARLRQDSAENKLLRGMLQSLLNAIELGNSVALSETMQVLDAKISALIGESKAAKAAPSEATAPEAEVPDVEVFDPAPLEARMPEVEVAEAAGLDAGGPYPLEEQSATPEPEAAKTAPEPEVVPEADTVADEMQAAAEPMSEPETEAEAEAETGVAEDLNTPASDAPPAADAAVASPVDEAGAALEIPAVAGGGEQKPEASSLEDIMRRVSKLVEDESALGPRAADGVQIDENTPYPKTQGPQPADAQKLASGG